MNPCIEPTDLQGAMTLVRDCVGGCAGERLLIVSEPQGSGYYDDEAPKLAAAAGRFLGLTVYETESTSFIKNEKDKSLLLDTLHGFDHIVFFSRIGDQIRFADNSDMPSSTMCYTLNRKAMDSSFGTACYQGMSEIKHAIDDALAEASTIRVTCPRGSDYQGAPNRDIRVPSDVSVKRFPLLVPRPVASQGFSGRIALSRFLVGTGSQAYEPYYLSLPNDVFACVKDNLITHFEGADADVERVENHYRDVSQQLTIKPWHVDSWHAGIHPGCHFDGEAESDILRWSGTAFGNPRILHFHTCGEYAPGEICWHVFDPTITLDGVPVWDNGQLYPDRLPNGKAILLRHPNLAALFENPYRNIGLAV